ncbi:MAG: alpha/beta fold hydrolase [Ardenticatenaceae bacterium]|nr:alpha/beta fold hydrolase [Ardenticatenaceae bacterium]
MNIFFIHGGGEGAFAADKPLAASLQSALGTDHIVNYSPMPDSKNPQLEAWFDRLSQYLEGSSGPVVMVGHSFGGSTLLKYLAEKGVDKVLAGVFLIAAPFWGAPDWEVDQFVLPDNFAEQFPDSLPIFFYHGRADDIVPVEHISLYAREVKSAIFREFDGFDHQFNNDLTAVAADILNLPKPGFTDNR